MKRIGCHFGLRDIDSGWRRINGTHCSFITELGRGGWALAIFMPPAAFEVVKSDCSYCTEPYEEAANRCAGICMVTEKKWPSTSGVFYKKKILKCFSHVVLYLNVLVFFLLVLPPHGLGVSGMSQYLHSFCERKQSNIFSSNVDYFKKSCEKYIGLVNL